MSSSGEDNYPSLLWLTIPPIILFASYVSRKWYLARRLRLHGIGKGAPGFQTSVRRVRVTPEIAARLRRGEDVSPEEIAAASAKMEEQDAAGTASDLVGRGVKEEIGPASSTENEWLPDSLKSTKQRTKRKKR